MNQHRLNIWICTAIGFLLLISCQPEKGGTSEVRIINLLMNREKVKIALEGKADVRITLSQGDTSGYATLPKGELRVTVSDTSGQEIMKRNLGIGKGGRFTFLLRGIVPETNTSDRLTTKTRLMRIFEGATAWTSNSGMPVLSVLLDQYEGSEKKGKVRFVHGCPGISSLDVFIYRNDKPGKTATISYPHVSQESVLPPGRYPAEVRLKGSDTVIGRDTLDIRKGSLTTGFIIGIPSSYPSSVDLLTLHSK